MLITLSYTTLHLQYKLDLVLSAHSITCSLPSHSVSDQSNFTLDVCMSAVAKNLSSQV